MPYEAAYGGRRIPRQVALSWTHELVNSTVHVTRLPHDHLVPLISLSMVPIQTFASCMMALYQNQRLHNKPRESIKLNARGYMRMSVHWTRLCSSVLLSRSRVDDAGDDWCAVCQISNYDSKSDTWLIGQGVLGYSHNRIVLLILLGKYQDCNAWADCKAPYRASRLFARFARRRSIIFILLRIPEWIWLAAGHVCLINIMNKCERIFWLFLLLLVSAE